MAAATSSRANDAWCGIAGTPGSLKRRVLRDIALLASLCWLVLTLGLLALVRIESARLFDDSLAELARVALAFSQHELAELAAADDTTVGEDLEGAHDASVLYQVWHADGRLAFRSRLAPQQPLLPPGDGFRDVVFAGAPMRAFSTWNEDRSFQVQIAQTPQPRDSYAMRFAALVAGVMSIALMAFLLLLGRRLRHTFAALDRAAAELGGRSAGELQPVPAGDAPAELAPVIVAFNGLMARVQRGLQHEQRFTSDAAHELKTPLASLKILLRNAERAPDAEQRLHELQRMHEVVDRSSALVDQLLALARYDRDPGAFDITEDVDLQALCAGVVQQHRALAGARQVQLGFAAAGDRLVVQGHREALATLVRNLLDNAIRHARRPGRVQLRLAAQSGVATIEVHDDGPGVPAELRSRVFDRFFRATPQRGPGAGLGLAIAERIADLHGGHIELRASQPLGGALALACLPLRPPLSAESAPGAR